MYGAMYAMMYGLSFPVEEKHKSIGFFEKLQNIYFII